MKMISVKKSVAALLFIVSLLYAGRVVIERKVFDLDKDVDIIVQVEVVDVVTKKHYTRFPNGVERFHSTEKTIHFRKIAEVKGRWQSDTLSRTYKQRTGQRYDTEGNPTVVKSLLITREDQTPPVVPGDSIYLLYQEIDEFRRRYLGFANDDELSHILCVTK